MMYVIDLRVIPLFLLWILCLFVASKTLTRKQTTPRFVVGKCACHQLRERFATVKRRIVVENGVDIRDARLRK